VKKAALATSVYNKATCCKADPKKSEKPIKSERTTNVLKSNSNSDLNFFISNKKTNGAIAKNPTKNLTALKVKGPISSIPVSCAMNVVPQIKVHSKALNNETVFDIIF
tara:strand:+ start:51 stop:374 length:324 start_codon:yes stop_codon:yes gene_type:complete